ncbi:DUF1810 domain-containing protein [Arcticibacter sp.]|jgi:uncharacterized protein (DUF1810 family)|uniref:DUF1810 domain-containing protein n=1 Tax=Arcticibacter sp. TaxID=1872630 RepID=UPI00388F0032
MAQAYDLERFVSAQKDDYETAFSEIENGRKRSHWMWYIFPQIQGLGFSETSRYYALKDLHEAEAFLTHELLGSRLIKITNQLLQLKEDDANRIFGSPDDLKLKSSMTLFCSLDGADPVFEAVLDKFFKGIKDEKTLKMMGKQE